MSSTENKHPYCSATKKVAAIGMFDGVHIGHQHLIKALLATAKSRNMESMVITFNEHPAATLQRSTPAMLMDREQRKNALQETGISHVLFLDFTAEMAHLSARDFMKQHLRDRYGVTHLLIGYDHHFGSDHLASFADYQAAAARVGLTILPIEQAPEGDVSSSKIRRALCRGAIESANIMLGYPYTLTGTVVHGRGLGRTIGFPTANIALPADKILPANGVYAVECLISHSASDPTVEGGLTSNSVSGLLNIGTNPTVGDNAITLEVHIPDFVGDLYDQQLSIRLLRFIREEKCFDSLDALKDQIRQDLQSL